MTAAQKTQLGRVVRLLVFTLASSAVVVNAVSMWQVKYPLLGLVIGALEALYRTAVPTVAAPGPGDVLSPAFGPGLGLPAIPPGVVESTLRTAPGTGVPMQGIDVPRNPDGTSGPATISSEPPKPGS